MHTTMDAPGTQDRESETVFERMGEQQAIRPNRVPGVKTVLVILSAAGMAFDIDALRQKILLAYREAAVFFHTTDGKPVGAESPRQVDLLIDFTGPGQRQCWLYAKKLRRMAKVAVGRNAGLFRKKIYHRVFDEKARASSLSGEISTRERQVQREVLELAGVACVPAGNASPDRGKTIALELPPMQKL